MMQKITKLWFDLRDWNKSRENANYELMHAMIDPPRFSLLVDQRADIRFVDVHGTLPLYYALIHGDDFPDIISILLDAKADPNKIYGQSFTSLLSGYPKKVDIVKEKTVLDVLLQNRSLDNDETIKALTCLLQAKTTLSINPHSIDLVLRSRTPSVLKILLDAKADPESCGNEHSDTWLHRAVRFGNLESIKTLLKAKANVFACNDFGLSVLDMAKTRSQHNSPEIEELLINEINRINGSKTLLGALHSRTGKDSTIQHASTAMNNILDPQVLRLPLRFAYGARDKKRDEEKLSIPEGPSSRRQNELEENTDRAIDGPEARGAVPEPAYNVPRV